MMPRRVSSRVRYRLFLMTAWCREVELASYSLMMGIRKGLLKSLQAARAPLLRQ